LRPHNGGGRLVPIDRRAGLLNFIDLNSLSAGIAVSITPSHRSVYKFYVERACDVAQAQAKGVDRAMTVLQMEGVTSGASDMGDLSLDVEVNIDDVEYARVMRRIIIGDGGTDAVVSAFNSSI
jgi:hypothetical protein